MKISIEDFQSVELRAGTIVRAEPNKKAKKPALFLEIDFGALGLRTSSAQIATDYQPSGLVGRQVVAVMNLPALNVAGVESQVLVVAAVDGIHTSLLLPDPPVSNGAAIS